MAKLTKEAKNKFNPHFNTYINGRVVKLTIKEVESNWHLYINGPLYHFFEDKENLKKRAATFKTSKAKTVLNMEAGNRGQVFAKDYQNPRQKAIDRFLEQQAAKRSKLEARSKKTTKKKTTKKPAQTNKSAAEVAAAEAAANATK